MWRGKEAEACRGRKLHWHSIDGSMQGGGGLEVRNRGAIHFAPRPCGCNVRLSFEFEVPDPLVPFANALTPLADGILDDSMATFAQVAAAESKLSAST